MSAPMIVRLSLPVIILEELRQKLALLLDRRCKANDLPAQLSLILSELSI